MKPDLLLIYRKSNTHTLKLARLDLTQRAFQLSRCSGLQPNTACSQLTGVFGALGRILGKAPIITAWRRLKPLLLLVFIWIDHRIINPRVWEISVTKKAICHGIKKVFIMQNVTPPALSRVSTIDPYKLRPSSGTYTHAVDNEDGALCSSVVLSAQNP